MPDSELNIKVTATTDDAKQNVSDLSDHVTSSTAQATQQASGRWDELSTAIVGAFQKAEKEAKDKLDETKKHSDKAKDAIGLLGKVTGIEVPEALQKVASESKTLGPILEKAFNGIAILALLQLVADVARKLTDLYTSTFVFTEKMQQQDVALQALNQRFVKAAEQRKNSEEELFKLQHSGSEIAAADLEKVLAQKAALQEKLNANNKAIAAANKELEEHSKVWLKAGSVGQEAIKDAQEGIQNLRNEGAALSKEILGIAAATETVQEKFKQLKQSEDEAARQKALAAYQAFQQRQFKAFTDGLEKQKEALDAFHTLSKADEAAYWDAILKTGKAKGNLKGENLKQVEHLATEAHKEDLRQRLKEEVENVEAQVQTTKAGSQERIQIVTDEIKKLEAQHLADTAEYKQFVREKQQADTDATAKALHDEIEHVHERVAATRAGSSERIQILESEIKKLANENRRDTEEYKQLVKEKIQSELDFMKQKEAAEEEARKSGLQHQEALKAQVKSRLDFERQIGKISEAEYEQELRTEIDATFAAVKKELEIEKNKHQQGTKEFEKAKAALLKLEDKYNADVQKLEQQSYLRRRQQFDQYFKQISSQFNTAINGWIQGTETASQAFSKMFQGILQDLISFVEQWIERKIEMWLIDKLLSQKGHSSETRSALTEDVTQIEGQALLAAANAFAANAWDIPTALLASGEAFSIVSGLGATAAGLSAKSAAGGWWQVDSDQLAFVHKNEMVLPASYASGLRDVVQGGSGGSSQGVTVMVNHTVNAIDAASFQSSIKRHGNIIGNEVARVLKQKGYGSK